MRTTLQDVATRHRLHPRKLLRAVTAALEDEGRPDYGPFDVELEELGVRASRKAGATRTSYAVTDEDALVEWYGAIDVVRITRHEAEEIVGLLEGYRRTFAAYLQGSEENRATVERGRAWERRLRGESDE